MNEEQDYPQRYPYQAPMHNQGSNILFLTNPDTELYKLELTFRGKMENSKGEVVTMSEKPLMNEKGINNVLGYVRSVVNQVNIMGNLEKEEIPGLMNFLADGIIKNLMVSRNEYELTRESRDQVFVSTMNLAFFTMKRALNEGDRRFWKGSTQEIRTSVETNQKTKGLLSKLNPWSS